LTCGVSFSSPQQDLAIAILHLLYHLHPCQFRHQTSMADSPVFYRQSFLNIMTSIAQSPLLSVYQLARYESSLLRKESVRTTWAINSSSRRFVRVTFARYMIRVVGNTQVNSFSLCHRRLGPLHKCYDPLRLLYLLVESPRRRLATNTKRHFGRSTTTPTEASNDRGSDSRKPAARPRLSARDRGCVSVGKQTVYAS